MLQQKPNKLTTIVANPTEFKEHVKSLLSSLLSPLLEKKRKELGEKLFVESMATHGLNVIKDAATAQSKKFLTLDSGESMELSPRQAEKLILVWNSLNDANRNKMYSTLMKNSIGFQKIVLFVNSLDSRLGK